MARRGKPQIEQGQSLDYQPGVANIAENKAQLDAMKNANIDGQDVYPQSVTAQSVSAAEGFFIDESTWLADGVVTSDQMATDSVLVGALDNSVTGRIFVSSTAKTNMEGWATGGTNYTEIDGNKITTGSLTVTNLAEISTLLAGNITLSSNSDGTEPVTGVYITDTQIKMTNSGTIYLNFDTVNGQYYMNGTGTFSGTVYASAGTFSGTVQAASAVYGAIQSTATIAGTAASTVTSGSASGAQAVQPGGGVSVDANKYITTIDCGTGITIRDSTSNQVVINSTGITIQNSSTGNRLQITETNVVTFDANGNSTAAFDATGISVRNRSGSSSGSDFERISLIDNLGTERSMLWAFSSGSGSWWETNNHDIYLGAGSKGSTNYGSGHLWSPQGSAYRWKIADGRMYGPTPPDYRNVPIVVAGTTTIYVYGTPARGSAGVTWSNMLSAPSAMVVNAASDGIAEYVCGVASIGSSGATIYAERVDGGTAYGYKTVHWMAVWD